MVQLPVRKCFYVVKVGVVCLLVVTILAMVEKWRGGKRTARAQDLDPLEAEYERQVLADEARIIPGLGEGGVAAHLSGKDKQLGEESEKKLAINVYLSDRIAYNRTLKDHRNPACQRVVYDAELPSVSVIIIFHNEPYSVVIRTIWSVVNSARRDQPWYKKANFVDRETGRTMTLGYPGQDPNSPYVYLKEIILVDDNSTLPELKGKLSHYIRTRLPPGLIRILRLPERVGLTRARLAGARYATAEALVFLDAHCEGQPDWLRPLLQRMKDAPHAVVMPIIDVVDAGNMYYSVADTAFFQVGGFNFMGHFTWIDVPEREKKRRGSEIGATWSPTMAGGLFAINREYYWELGAYDEQMAGWGGENLEMSFRIWQCGGTLETIPCSRVGHVFRAFHPYGMPASTDTHGINTARMAEVWMDDYKELFYLHRPDLRKNPKIGDVTHRKILREKLQCKNFEWYLQHIYKEKFVPVRDAFGYGRFKNPASGLCLDTLQREAEAAPLGVYPCHPTLQGTQYLSLALDGQLRDEERCVILQYARETEAENNEGRKLLLVSCNKKLNGQKWKYTPTKQLIHVATGLCLDAGFEGGADVLAVKCRSGAPTQKWDIDYSEHNGFRLSEDREPSEAELTLQKLRGQRRISRSLMSYGENDNATDSNKIRRHSHKKKKHKKGRKHGKIKRSHSKTKNKFILQLVRTLMNNSEDHLEVDIHCKHRQLYPNNSFVRDLVTILNERNIKVINNGRVFERNRVTELVKDPTTMRQTEGKVLKKLEVEQRPPNNPPPQPQPVIPPSQVARIGPVQNQQMNRWLNKKRRLKVAAPANAQGIIAMNSPINEQVVYNQQDANDALADKKIIIEDFVEVKPSAAATPEPFKIHQRARKQSGKKRKRKHHHGEHTQPQPSHRSRGDSTQMPVQEKEYEEDSALRGDSSIQKQGSIEEVPMVSREATSGRRSQTEILLDSADRDESERDTEWFTGTANPVDPPHNNSRAYSRRRGSEDSVLQPSQAGDDNDTGDKTESSAYQPSPEDARNTSSARFRHGAGGAGDGGHAASPLKVVMKSNLTFNLGDEFFKWRATDDVTDILGELAIPSNSSRAAPPIHAWIKPLPAARHNSRARNDVANLRSDTVLTGHGAHQMSSNSGGSGGERSDGEEKKPGGGGARGGGGGGVGGGGNSVQANSDKSGSSSSESDEITQQRSNNGFY